MSELPASCTFENCAEQVISVCLECKLAFCLEHASEVDPARYCCNCLVPADTQVKEDPLIDKDGVKHTGRVIHLVGRSYRMTEKLVDQMSEDELKEFIEYGKQMVTELANMKLHWDISLGLAESAAWHKQIGNLAKFGGELRVGTSTQHFKRNVPRKSVTQPATKANKVDKTVELLKQLGLKPEDLVALLNALPAKK